MNVPSKRTSRMISMLLVLTMLMGLLTVSVSAQPAAQGSKVEDAILYTINADNELEYNVVYSSAMTEATHVSGEGISSIDELKTALGTPDDLGDAITANLTITDGSVTEIVVQSIAERPIIGISWKKDSIGSDYSGFAEAFERNGAISVFLPQVKTEEEAADVLSSIDGIFFTGGEDWNPDLYHEIQTPHGSSGWNDARDTSDIYLMRKAVELDVPLLAVCRGEQGFNVALGGKLIQDVPYYLGQQVLKGEISPARVTGVLSGPSESEMAQLEAACEKFGLEEIPEILAESVQDTGYTKYDENGEKLGSTYDKGTGTYTEFGEDCKAGHLRVQIDGLVHSGGKGYHKLDAGTDGDGIGIATDSKWLYDIIGSDEIELVATAHHQSIDPENLADGLTVVAKSSDGIIEAVEYQEATFALALQWHPERDALEDTRDIDVDQDLSNAPLRALVEYARLKIEEEEEEIPGGGDEGDDEPFQPAVTYEFTVTDEERAAIHEAVDNLAGYVGDMVVGDETYNPYTLVGALAEGSSYDSISYGATASGDAPTEYPFYVPNTEANKNEHDRKVAKLAWVKELGEALGLEVVQRQEDKYVYVEIGDPDAPEMVMALSHLDSPTGSISDAQLKRWRDPTGKLGAEGGDPAAYHTPYVKDGWAVRRWRPGRQRSHPGYPLCG